jgi:hypothetical protein
VEGIPEPRDVNPTEFLGGGSGFAEGCLDGEGQRVFAVAAQVAFRL